MDKVRHILLCMAVATGLFAANPAFASSWQVWDGTSWQSNGTLNLTGQIGGEFGGTPYICQVGTFFTLTVTGGSAKITNVSFPTPGFCPRSATKPPVGATSLPWNLSAPVISGTNASTTMTGIVIYFVQPTAYCPGLANTFGTASATFTNANPNTTHANNNFTFAGTFPNGACRNIKTLTNMTTSKPLRAIP